MKESQYYEVGRIGMIMKQLKWMMGKKIWDVAEGMEDEKEREKFIEEEVKKY